MRLIRPLAKCTKHRSNLHLLIFFLLTLVTPIFSIASTEVENDIAPTAETEPTTNESTELSAFDQALKLLRGKSFKEKMQAIELIAESKDERALSYLQLMLDARLYYQKDSLDIVAAKRDGKNYQLTNPSNGEDLVQAQKRYIKNGAINNSFRGKLRVKIAQLISLNPGTNVC